MCLLTRQIKPITTKKDMVVVKKLHATRYGNNVESEITYTSYFSDIPFVYIKGKLNKTELGITRNIPKNQTSFSDADTKYYKSNNPMPNRKITIISEGFHFIVKDSVSYNELVKHFGEIIFEFLVPKGSQIFLGKTGLGVSNQIIML